MICPVRSESRVGIGSLSGPLRTVYMLTSLFSFQFHLSVADSDCQRTRRPSTTTSPKAPHRITHSTDNSLHHVRNLFLLPWHLPEYPNLYIHDDHDKLSRLSARELPILSRRALRGPWRPQSALPQLSLRRAGDCEHLPHVLCSERLF